jgi:hypothetical protein
MIHLFGTGLSMGNPKIAVIAYGLAIGFILVVVPLAITNPDHG